MARFVELRRHTDNDGDVLTAEGVAAALRLGDGDRALAVGHSPTNEAAVLGLTGRLIAPLAKGAGVLVAADEGGFGVEPLDP